jgi:hypothetical protein
MGLTCSPKQKADALKTAAESEKDLAKDVQFALTAVEKAWHQKLITTDQKNRLAHLLGQIASGDQKAIEATIALQAAGSLDTSELSTILNDQVVAPFLNVLTEIGKLTPDSSAAIRAAIAGIRTTILLLSQKIGRNDVIEKINSRWVNA